MKSTRTMELMKVIRKEKGQISDSQIYSSYNNIDTILQPKNASHLTKQTTNREKNNQGLQAQPVDIFMEFSIPNTMLSTFYYVSLQINGSKWISIRNE